MSVSGDNHNLHPSHASIMPYTPTKSYNQSLIVINESSHKHISVYMCPCKLQILKGTTKINLSLILCGFSISHFISSKHIHILPTYGQFKNTYFLFKNWKSFFENHLKNQNLHKAKTNHFMFMLSCINVYVNMLHNHAINILNS